MRITSDKKNFAMLLCNLAAVGYIKPEEMFPKISVREFYSDKYNRSNLVVEEGITWEDIQKASEGGNPCLSYSSFQSLIKLLNNAGLLHNTNKEATNVEEMFDKLRVELWTGRNEQPMISLYHGEKTEKAAPEVDTSLGFLNEEEEKPAEEKAEEPTVDAAVATATVAAEGTVNPDDLPF